MNLKNFVVLASLLMLLSLSIGMVSANENLTMESDGTNLEDIKEEYDAEIVTAENYTTHYMSDDELYFELQPSDVVEGNIDFDVVDNNTGRVIGQATYLAYFNHGYGYVDAAVGNYKAILKASDIFKDSYKIKPAVINVKITKAPVILTAHKWISTTKNYATLKATVKDESYSPVCVGTVKFSINGKTYSVKVKNGVAVKKVKLTKAKTYTYKATFSSKNYKTKTKSSNVYIKKAKSYYTFKAGKYSCKMSYGKYVKLITAKNNKKYRAFAFVVGKQYGIYPIHMAVNTLPKDMQSKKGDYVQVWIDNGRGIDSTIQRKINLYTLNP